MGQALEEARVCYPRKSHERLIGMVLAVIWITMITPTSYAKDYRSS